MVRDHSKIQFAGIDETVRLLVQKRVPTETRSFINDNKNIHIMVLRAADGGYPETERERIKKKNRKSEKSTLLSMPHVLVSQHIDVSRVCFRQ